MLQNATAPSPPAFRPVRTARLCEEVINRIALMVSDGQLVLNQRFPSERDLQGQWQVSRPVLREAFRILEMQGIVESRPGGGRYLRSTRVLDPALLRSSQLEVNRELLFQIWEAREAVETKICELAAARASPDQIAMIERPLILVASETPEALERLDLNREFHAAIATAAGNPILEEMSERLLRKSAQVGFRHIVGAQDWAALQGEHRPILEAIKAHDPVAAREAMAHHFRVLRNRADASGKPGPAIPPG